METLYKRLKKQRRKITKQAWVHTLLTYLVVLYIKLIRRTSRWRVEGTAARDQLFAAGQPFIIALWHNRIGMMPYAFEAQNHRLTIVTSSHRDGAMVIKGLGQFGFNHIVLDNRAPRQATKAIVRCLREGGHVGITPDGPRGPNQQAKEGIIRLAALARVPIIPVSYAVKRHRRARSWDNFLIPLPFNRGVCHWGEAIDVPVSAGENRFEQARQQLEQSLHDLGERAEISLGQKNR